MGSRRYTRRRALQGAGAALAGIGMLGARASFAVAQESALDVGRAATLAAIMAALAHGPAEGVDAADYVERFGANYEAASLPFRAYVDESLDAVAAEPAFMLASPQEAYGVLLDWAAQTERQPLVAGALEMASLTFEEDDYKTPGYGLVTGGVS